MTWIISIILFVGGLGSGMAFPILPALGQKLGIAGFMIGLILSSDKIARLMFNLPAGQLFPRLGVRRMVGGAMLAATAGMLCFSAAMSSENPAFWLLIGRFIYGMGTSFLMVGAQAAVLGLSDKSNRGRKMASLRLAVNSAIPGGLVLGGLISDLYSDYIAFLIGSAVTFAGTLMAIVLLPGTSDSETTPKIMTSRIQKKAGHFFPKSPGLFAAFILNFLIFLTVQGALMSTLVLFLQQRHLYLAGMEGQGSSGLVMAVMVSCAALSSFAAGRILDRLPRRSQLIFPALGGLAIGFLVLSRATSITGVFVASILIGLTYNSLTIPTMAFIGDQVHGSEQSRSVGLLQFFGDLGGTLGPILGIWAASLLGVGNLYLAMALLSLCSLPAAFRMSQIERQSASASAVGPVANPQEAESSQP